MVVEALVAIRSGSERGPAKVLVAVVEVAVKYGEEMFVREEMLPVAVMEPEAMPVPSVRVEKVALVPESEEKFWRVPPLRSPFRTMRFVRSSMRVMTWVVWMFCTCCVETGRMKDEARVVNSERNVARD